MTNIKKQITVVAGIICLAGTASSAFAWCWQACSYTKYTAGDCIYNSPSADCYGQSYFPESHYVNQTVTGKHCCPVLVGSYLCNDFPDGTDNWCTMTVVKRICSRLGIGEEVTSTDTLVNVKSDDAEELFPGCDQRG